MQKCKYACGIWTLLIAVGSICFAANSEREAFNLAWKSFGNGEYAAAEDVVDAHLERGVEDLHLRANFYYLKSHIQGKKPDEAEASLDAMIEAHRLYTSLESQRGMYNTNLGLAKLLIDQGREGEAEGLVHEAIEIGEQLDRPLGYTYYLAANLAFRQEHFRATLLYSLDSYSSYQQANDLKGMISARAESGFFYMLNGYWEEGRIQVEIAQQQIAHESNKNQQIYALISTILYRRCVEGRNDTALIQVVRMHAETNNDEDLRESLDYVLSLDCGTTTLRGDGQPPDPPPPPL